jgi:hypothetical protein
MLTRIEDWESVARVHGRAARLHRRPGHALHRPRLARRGRGRRRRRGLIVERRK